MRETSGAKTSLSSDLPVFSKNYVSEYSDHTLEKLRKALENGDASALCLIDKTFGDIVKTFPQEPHAPAKNAEQPTGFLTAMLKGKAPPNERS